MKGLLRRIFYEVRAPVLLFGIGLAIIMGLLTALLPKVLGDIDKLFGSIPFIKPILSALLGVDPGEAFTGQLMQAFLWVHPTVLAIMWAHELMYCSRVPAAEIDRGSIDFLLGLPISRWKLYIAETIGWILSGLVVLSCGFTGHVIASQTMEPEMLPSGFATFSVLTNLFAVYLAVGAIAMMFSAMSDRRGRAIGVVFGMLVCWFLVNFLSQPLPILKEQEEAVAAKIEEAEENSNEEQKPIWQPAKNLSFLSVMEYYRPAYIIESNAFPWQNTGILLSVAIVFWTIGGIIFRRRSICTV